MVSNGLHFPGSSLGSGVGGGELQFWPRSIWHCLQFSGVYQFSGNLLLRKFQCFTHWELFPINFVSWSLQIETWPSLFPILLQFSSDYLTPLSESTHLFPGSLRCVALLQLASAGPGFPEPWLEPSSVPPGKLSPVTDSLVITSLLAHQLNFSLIYCAAPGFQKPKHH